MFGSPLGGLEAGRKCSAGGIFDLAARRGEEVSLVPETVVWEMVSAEDRTSHWRKGRRGLEVSGQLVKTLLAVHGTVTWELLRKIAFSQRANRMVTREKRRDFIARRYERRVRRLAYDKELQRRQAEELLARLGQLERELDLERQSNSERKLLLDKIIYQAKDRRNVKTQTYATDFVYETEELTKILTELRHVKELYMKQKLLTASICEKYVKMREAKDALWRKLARLEGHYRAVLEGAMAEFDKDRRAFALVERDGKLRGRIHEDLVNRCSALSYNNAALHVALLRRQGAGTATKDVAGDISIFSILRDTNKLARYEEKMKKLLSRRKETFKEMVLLNNEDSEGKFVTLPLVLNEEGGEFNQVPLFEVENSEEDSGSEREEDEDEEAEEDDGKDGDKIRINSSLFSKSEESRSWQQDRYSSSDLGYTSGGPELAGRRRSAIEAGGMTRKEGMKWALRSESAQEVKIPLPKNDSAPDIIQAVPTGFRIT